MKIVVNKLNQKNETEMKTAARNVKIKQCLCSVLLFHLKRNHVSVVTKMVTGSRQ